MMVNSEPLKMFWEVWRNVTSATTGWSLGGNGGTGSGGAKRGKNTLKKNMQIFCFKIEQVFWSA